MRYRIAAAAGCSALFMLVYQVTNALAAGRAEQWFAPWELSIPFMAWMVVPYVSLDLFFVAAPFVCSTRREVGVLVRRLVTAIGIAGIFFFVMPLTPGFERATVSGPLHPLFASLYAFDKPYNLFPSLHVTIAFILRWTYHRHLRGGWRWLMHGWFVLITASTVLTHQHHLIDLVGGAGLGLLVFYLFPTGLIAREDVRVSGAPSRKLALVYGLAAGGVLFLGLHLLLSGWISLSLLIVALGYGGLGPRVFRKYAGYLSIPARIVLAPYLFGLWLTRCWFWSRDRRGVVRVSDGVYIGRLPDARVCARLRDLGVTTVIDLTAEHSVPRAVRALDYYNFPVMDLTRPDESILASVAAAIDRAHGAVYVHCALGLGRSATAVA